MRTHLLSSRIDKKIEFVKTGDRTYRISEEKGKPHQVSIRKIGPGFFFTIDGKRWQRLVDFKATESIVVLDEIVSTYFGFVPSGVGKQDEGSLSTQMPGKVVKIFVSEGDSVKKGDPILILEAMKMENEVKAPKDGVIASIEVSEGQAVDTGSVLANLD
jgi:biotin carboxyl carrier protein